ncbi:MAG TPA: EamA family transporter RarD, partial [Gemmataceae bacterium]|nr:EamA family transporter RarD [Gemmataceae bacterium]
MPSPSTSASRQGLLYGVAAYACWGLAVPLYFKAVSWVSPLELLAQRVLWSVAVLVGLLVITRRWKELRQAVRSPRTLLLLGAGSVLIGVNWLIYIYSVVTDQMVESGLGYFMLPLVSVLFGMLFLGERLRRGQWLAVGLAGLGVVNLAVRTDTIPWIALALAGAFGLYGLLRKLAPVESLISLLVETAILAPFAAAWMGWRQYHGGTAWAGAGWGPDLVLALSGVVTAFPLLWFGKAA